MVDSEPVNGELIAHTWRGDELGMHRCRDPPRGLDWTRCSDLVLVLMAFAITLLSL